MADRMGQVCGSCIWLRGVVKGMQDEQTPARPCCASCVEKALT